MSRPRGDIFLKRMFVWINRSEEILAIESGWELLGEAGGR